MVERSQRSAVRHRGSQSRVEFRLVVFHASQNVHAHIAPLTETPAFGVTCHPQSELSQGVSQPVDAVLWELTSDAPPDMARLTTLAEGAVLLSYAEPGDDALAERSAELGFFAHLPAPLSGIQVSPYLSVQAPTDLATRLREATPTLHRNLGHAPFSRDFARLVSTPLTRRDVADALLTSVVGWLPAASWTLVGTDATGSTAVIGERGLAPEAEMAARALGLWVMSNSRERVAASLREAPAIPGAPDVAALGFPLMCRGRTVAALVGLDREASREAPRLPGGTLKALLELLQTAAVALDNAARIEHAEELSVTDDLTKLYNSRYLTQALRREAKRSSRSHQPLSLLFIDMDGFKQVNDQHGHLFGSRSLVEVATIIRECCRETDVAARYGGDEFAVVLPDTGREGAMAVASRFCQRVRDHVFLQEEGINFRLTASTGVATLPDNAATAEELIQVADEAMYQVKAAGKDGIQPAGEGSREGVSA